MRMRQLLLVRSLMLVVLALLLVIPLIETKSVKLVADFASGQSLERSVSFRWVTKRDSLTASNGRPGESEAELHATRWEPRTIKTQQQRSRTNNPEEQELLQQRPRTEEPNGSTSGDPIEASFNVDENQDDHPPEGARSLNISSIAPLPGQVLTGQLTPVNGTGEGAEEQKTTLSETDNSLGSASNETVNGTMDEGMSKIAAPIAPTNQTTASGSGSESKQLEAQLEAATPAGPQLNVTQVQEDSRLPNSTSEVKQQSNVPSAVVQVSDADLNVNASTSDVVAAAAAAASKAQTSVEAPVAKMPPLEAPRTDLLSPTESAKVDDLKGTADMSGKTPDQQANHFAQATQVPNVQVSQDEPQLNSNVELSPPSANSSMPVEMINQIQVQSPSQKNDSAGTQAQNEVPSMVSNVPNVPSVPSSQVPPVPNATVSAPEVEKSASNMSSITSADAAAGAAGAAGAAATALVPTPGEQVKSNETSHEADPRTASKGDEPQEVKTLEQDNSISAHANVSHNSIPHEPHEPQELVEEANRPSYHVDSQSCGHLPQAELEKQIEVILNTLASANCSSLLAANGLKLRPVSNGQISGHLMEVSSMPLDLDQLLHQAQATHVSCLPSEGQNTSSTSELTNLRLRFDQELADQWLVSSWRLHPKLGLDELSQDVLRAPAGYSRHSAPLNANKGRQFKKSAWPASTAAAISKCQMFKVESGQFHLKLMGLKASAIYELRANAINLTQFHVRRLYLDHGLKLDADAGGPSASLVRRPQQTAQILHSRNDHYRRNNWLLDLYGNWLKHEYRGQLAHLLVKRADLLSQQLGACFR